MTGTQEVIIHWPIKGHCLSGKNNPSECIRAELAAYPNLYNKLSFFEIGVFQPFNLHSMV